MIRACPVVSTHCSRYSLQPRSVALPSFLALHRRYPATASADVFAPTSFPLVPKDQLPPPLSMTTSVDVFRTDFFRCPALTIVRPPVPKVRPNLRCRTLHALLIPSPPLSCDGERRCGRTDVFFSLAPNPAPIFRLAVVTAVRSYQSPDSSTGRLSSCSTGRLSS